MNVSEKITSIGVVPVIKLNNPERDAAPLADALCKGGVPVAEVTFRAAGAAKAIELMSKAHPEMLVGAGTVLTTTQIDEAVNAGASFIVTQVLISNSLNMLRRKTFLYILVVLPLLTITLHINSVLKF